MLLIIWKASFPTTHLVKRMYLQSLHTNVFEKVETLFLFFLECISLMNAEVSHQKCHKQQCHWNSGEYENKAIRFTDSSTKRVVTYFKTRQLCVKKKKLLWSNFCHFFYKLKVVEHLLQLRKISEPILKNFASKLTFDQLSILFLFEKI